MWEEIKKVELVHVVVVVVGALGTATDNIQKWLGKNGLLIRTEVLQKTILRGTSRIPSKCWSPWRDKEMARDKFICYDLFLAAKLWRQICLRKKMKIIMIIITATYSSCLVH